MENTAPATDDFESLLIGYIPRLRRYAVALVRNREDADDLVQECLIRALTRMDRFELGTNLQAWLFAILHNLFLDSTRSARRRRNFERAMQVKETGTVTRPSQLRTVELQDLERALGELPPVQRSTVLLIAMEGLNYGQTAAITGVPVGTVRSRLSRARSALASAVNGTSLCEAALPAPAHQPKAMVA